MGPDAEVGVRGGCRMVEQGKGGPAVVGSEVDATCPEEVTAEAERR